MGIKVRRGGDGDIGRGRLKGEKVGRRRGGFMVYDRWVFTNTINEE